MNENDIIELKQLLSEPKNIVIVPHKNPDGDAIGSSLGLNLYLKAKGHNVQVVSPNDYPEFLKWLPESDEVLKFDMQNSQSKRALNKAEYIFLLDFNALHRTGDDMEKTLQTFEGDFIMIDHHQEPDPIAKYTFSDVAMSSTCQMIYQFMEMMDDLNFVNADVATCLYAGIMTDTGSFRYPATTSKTHHIIADLIDKGANNAVIHNQIYDTNSYNRMQLLGRALSNLKHLPKYKTAFIILSQSDLDEFNYEKGDTEGFVNYALSLNDVIFAAIFIEDENQNFIKISFRSKGSFSVNQFSRNHYNGGGHINAAGGRSEDSLDKTVKNFIKLLPTYQKEIESSYEV